MRITQCDRILRHMRDYGSITSLEAMTEYNILRLASRINDLKRRGYHITSENKPFINKYGEHRYYSVYKLIEEEK